MLMKPNANRPKQRQLIALAVLLAVLGGLVVFEVLPLFSGGEPAAPAPTAKVAPRPAPAAPPRAAAGRANARPATKELDIAAAAAAAAKGQGQVEDVHLARLKQTAPEPVTGRRNPFSLAPEPKPAPPLSAAAAVGPPVNSAPQVPAMSGPPPPPPPPPITLKFFGVVSAGGKFGKVAALGDGKFVYHGREGEIIEGRYRIVKIGEESIQLEYVDGRGRQTIRLSGK
jgi:hypothetical protein